MVVVLSMTEITETKMIMIFESANLKFEQTSESGGMYGVIDVF